MDTGSLHHHFPAKAALIEAVLVDREIRFATTLPGGAPRRRVCSSATRRGEMTASCVSR